VRRVSDITDCKQRGLTGIILHFQNSVPIGLDLRRLLIFYALGVRVIQLTYNRRNFVGDGCTVGEDAGLSEFGRRAVQEMNRLGIVVDLSHTGHRTTMEAIEFSSRPVIFSHSNIADVCPSKRNIHRDQVRAIAARNGVIGLNGVEYFVRSGRESTVDDLIAHADYIAAEVGTDHISLGLDHYWGHSPHLGEKEQHLLYSSLVSSGRLDPDTWPAPPWTQAKGIETPEETFALAESLARHGYADDDIRKIIGGNLMRVFEAVWTS
jgi:membrane dipeptidase